MRNLAKFFALQVALSLLSLVVGVCIHNELPKPLTIQLGTGLSGETFPAAIEGIGGQVNHLATDLLGQSAFTIAETETEVQLVTVSAAELGFPSGATREEIYKRAQERGLLLCPAEVGPQLLLQYDDQPYAKWLFIAMEPIMDSIGRLNVFRLELGDDRWLDADDGPLDGVWLADFRWVFLHRKSA